MVWQLLAVVIGKKSGAEMPCLPLDAFYGYALQQLLQAELCLSSRY